MFRQRHAWLAVAALAGGFFFAPASVRAVDAKLLPADTEWVFSLNIKQIMDSPLIKANKESIDGLLALAKMNFPADEGAEEFLKAAGFDMSKDLHSLSVAGPAGVDPDKLLIVVEGKFNTAKVHAAAEKAAKGAGDAVRITNIGAVKVYEVSVPGEKTIFVSLLDGKTLAAAASKESLSGAISRFAGKKIALKKEFRTLLDTTSDKQSLSFAATSAAIAKVIQNAPNVPRPDEIAAALGQVEGLSASVTIKKDIDFELAVNTKDDETAKNIGQGAQLAIGAMKAMMQKKAEGADPRAEIANDVLKTLRVTNKGANIIFSGQVTVDVLERIFKMLPGS